MSTKLLKQKKTESLIDGISLLSKDLQVQIMRELLKQSLEINLNSSDEQTLISESDNSVTDYEAETEGEVASQVKRRGRPPKSGTKLVAKEAKRVGRPPKSSPNMPEKETLKKKRGRPPKDKSVSDDVDVVESVPQEGLIKFFSAGDSRKSNLLSKLAADGIIPETKDGLWNTYNLVAVRGNKPKPITVKHKGREVEITPPPLIKHKSADDLVAWDSFERVLLDIKNDPYNAAFKADPKTITNRERQIGLSRGLRRKHQKFREGIPSKDDEIPMISAILARNILINCKSFERHLSHTIELSPASWLLPSAEMTDEFKEYIRNALLGEHPDFGRREKYALARLLDKTLGQIELALFDLAFK